MAVAVVFVGVLRLFCFGCGTTVETTVLPEVLLLLDNDDDGITTRGSTLGTVTNDGRFEIWAVMGVANVRRRRGGNGLGVCADVVVTADTRGELEAALVVTALVAACASIATAGPATSATVAVAVATSVVATFGCGLRRIIVVHKERRPR